MKFTLSYSYVISFIFLTNLTKKSCEAIKCYKCSVSPRPDETFRSCAAFDKSDKYVIDCPYSTFCMTKNFTVNFSSIQQRENVERNCASQKDESRKLRNKTWENVITIQEPYQEGCTQIDDKGQKITTTIKCYCKGDLCNTSNQFLPKTAIPAVIILILVNYLSF